MRGGPRRKKKEIYLPERVGGMSMASGSASGAANGDAEGVERIGTEEVKGGLSFGERTNAPAVRAETEEESAPPPAPSAPPPAISTSASMTEEQRALRELLGTEGGADGPADELDAIVSAPDARNGPIDESEAFKRDVDSRPDEVRSQSLACRPASALTNPPSLTGFTARLRPHPRRPIRTRHAARDGLATRPSRLSLRSRRNGSLRPEETRGLTRNRRDEYEYCAGWRCGEG